MKYAAQIIALIVAFTSVTTPTIYHLGPTGIFWTKVGYNVLSIAFWLGFFYLLWKYWRSEHKPLSRFSSFAWRWAAAAILTLPIFVLTLSTKLFAYGPYWSCPDRPMFAFGWPFPCKWETAGGPDFLPGVLALNLICCFGLLLFLFGFRKLKHFLIAFLTPILIFIGYVIVNGGAKEMYDLLTSRNLRYALPQCQSSETTPQPNTP